MSSQRADCLSGDGWAHGPGGHKVWGKYGAAGLFLIAGRGEDARILLQHRAEWTSQGGTWAIPGGARDLHESAVQAALRETQEECGINPADVEVVESLVTAGPYAIDGWTYTTVVARCAAPLATTANAESEELRWVDYGGIGKLELLGAFRQALPGVWEVARPYCR